MNLLKIKNLAKRFGGIAAVNDCTFSIGENSITALIGPNGAGKTTVFDLIAGTLPHDSGEIEFRGMPIGRLSAYRRARLGIARTFQAIRVFPELTASENITLALPENLEGLLDIFRPRKQRQIGLNHRALELLDIVGLREKARSKAGALSYGQQKLLEIMRAVATGADLLLLDEPAAGVNRTMLHQITALIKNLHGQGKTIVIVEHDMGFVMEISQRIIVMDYGKEIAQGTPEEIQKNPKVLEAYLGYAHH